MLTWFQKLQLRRETRHVHRFDDAQLTALIRALQPDSTVLLAVYDIRRRLKEMALNFDELNTAIAALHQDVQNIANRLESASGSDAENQAKIDDAVASLRAVDAALDSLAPDPEPTPE